MNGKLTGWLRIMVEYKFQVRHRLGAQNASEDHLSKSGAGEEGVSGEMEA